MTSAPVGLTATALTPAGLGAAGAAGFGAAGGVISGASALSPAATPEPLSLMLVGTGLVGLYRARRYFQ